MSSLAIRFVNCLLFLFLSVNAFAWDNADINLFRRHRFGFGTGYTRFDYREGRQFQPALSARGIQITGPLFYGEWNYWPAREQISTHVKTEIIGTQANRWLTMADVRLHQFWGNEKKWDDFHSWVAVGIFGIHRLQPQANRGYSGVYGLQIQPRLGYEWQRQSSYPGEVALWFRRLIPITGGNIDRVTSSGWAAGTELKIAIFKPPAFPTLFFERVLWLRLYYESLSLDFNEARRVETTLSGWVVSLGYEF